MNNSSNDELITAERRRIKGAYQVWGEQLRRVNRYFARLEAISAFASDALRFAADEHLLEYETDDIYSYFIHCYQLVDWIGEDPVYAHCKGKEPCEKKLCPECWVNSDRSLQIVRDLCNRVKHVRLSNDKTGKPRPIRIEFRDTGFPRHVSHLIQWPDQKTFKMKWREIKQKYPNAFGDQNWEQCFDKGYWDDGFEQECWLAAYREGPTCDALKVAALARDSWKQYFLKVGVVEDENKYEIWFGPASQS